MTSILLIEDHHLFADSLVRMLNGRGYKEVSVAYSAEDALRLLPDLSVDLALVDVALPKMNGIDLVEVLRSEYPELVCLVISGHMSTRYARRSLEAGARGYAVKDSAAGIIQGIQTVMRGEIYLSEDLGSL